jgi:hypothetical protein
MGGINARAPLDPARHDVEIFLAMRPPIFSPIARIGVRPEREAAEPGAFVAPRPRGSRRPHTDAKVLAVRELIEQTTLTYGQIAARTGVGRASICRWTRDGAWKRPPFAPRATDTVPRARASAHLKRRTLGARLAALWPLPALLRRPSLSNGSYRFLESPMDSDFVGRDRYRLSRSR